MTIAVNRNIDTAKLKELVMEKEKTTEEHRYEGKKEMTKVTYEEPSPEEWGGTSPFVTLEYDGKNCILLEITIQYNRREAKKDSVLTPNELKQKLMHEFENKLVFTGTYNHAAAVSAVIMDLEKRPLVVEKRVNFVEPEK